MVFQIPMTPPLQYLTLTLKGLGFDTFQTNLLAIPNTVVHSEWFDASWRRLKLTRCI